MIVRVLKSMRALFAVFLVLAAGVLYFMQDEAREFKAIAARGVETSAHINSLTETKGRFGAKTYMMFATFTNADGVTDSHLINVTPAYVQTISSGGVLLVDDIKVKYLPERPHSVAIPTDDIAGALKHEADMMLYCIALIVGSLIGLIVPFLLPRQ